MNLLSLSFFSISLMIACLEDVLKIHFSLASNTESTKISFSSVQNVLLLIHRYLEISRFAYSSKSCINLFWLNFLIKFYLIFRQFWNMNITKKIFHFYLSFLFPRFEKSFVKFSDVF